MVQELLSFSLTEHVRVGRTEAQKNLFHQKDCKACEWLDSVKMRTYATFDRQTDSHSDSNAHLRVVQSSAVHTHLSCDM